MSKDLNEVILGSGKLYVALFNGGAMPADTAIETDDNNVGKIKGGATLTYKPTIYDVVDDDEFVVKRIVTKEEVTFKSGILTWDITNLDKLSTASFVDDTTNHERIIKVGGKSKLDSYVIRFVHTKDDGTKLRMTIVGNSSNGFAMKFDPAKETVIDAEFKALSQDDGTLVEIRDGYTAVNA
ncbi:hypothetical protein IAI10_14230 [Clostridium sp. 19966]|uniref:hypothetical protein n=1 Tax=Clostridium sp. 19966 TaxID=2768166 RepID=UPI0028DFB72A|nr:hypothetical protein [Clostridium sp. 19966]MDT8717822.1 hypothetical protein [Clostridium sp. 19966]